MKSRDDKLMQTYINLNLRKYWFDDISIALQN